MPKGITDLGYFDEAAIKKAMARPVDSFSLHTSWKSRFTLWTTVPSRATLKNSDEKLT